MRTRKVWVGLAVLAVVAFATFYFASPLLALNSLRAAAKSGDRDRLEATVDFPSVRESLKAQFNAAMTAQMQSDPEMAGNPFAGLGLALMPAIINNMVDGFVTPEGISQMVTTTKAPEAEGRSTPSAATEAETKVRHRYSGLNRFKTTVQNASEPNAQVDLVLERRGLFGWKLVRIDMPKLGEAMSTTPEAGS